MIPFLAALQFLTIAPPLVKRVFTEKELGQAAGFYPLVGAIKENEADWEIVSNEVGLGLVPPTTKTNPTSLQSDCHAHADLYLA